MENSRTDINVLSPTPIAGPTSPTSLAAVREDETLSAFATAA